MVSENLLLEIQEQVKKIMATVLKVDSGAIGVMAERRQFEGWDSLTQLRLISALEEQFTVEFSDEQVMGLSSYPEVVAAIVELSKDA